MFLKIGLICLTVERSKTIVKVKQAIIQAMHRFLNIRHEASTNFARILLHGTLTTQIKTQRVACLNIVVC